MITKKEALVLGQLAASAGSELYGLQMVESSDKQLKLGTVYVILGRLEDKGFIEGRREAISERAVPRRLYKITGAGRRVYMAYSAANAVYGHELKGAAA